MRGFGQKITLLFIVLLISLLGCNLQYNMLYYPTAAVPSEAELAASGLRYWPSGPTGYRGFVTATGGGNTKGTIVVFHGNAGTAADRTYYGEALGPAGYRIILAEYPRYGRREGDLGERSFVADARASVRLALEQYGSPLFLLGESLGCGVAAGVARDASLKISGIILVTPWDTLAAVAKTHFPWMPVSLFLKDSYDNRENLRSFGGAVAIVAAGRDDIVPLKHATALYQSLSGTKRMWTIADAGHNDWPLRIDPVRWKEWMDFIQGDV